jgi:NAD(P)-dependent dehydrogenase (short-subunit alcohol dehydrogenase family)
MLASGKTVIVTGGASENGIGRATAKIFAEQGARVAIADIDASGAARTAAQLPGDGHIGIGCDVTSRTACDDAVGEVTQALGPPDVLINNAGVTQPLRLNEIGPEDYDKVMDVNLRGSLYMSQAASTAMPRGNTSSIVCISSVSAQRGGGIFGGPHYSAAKAGILGLVKAMAREFGPRGIRVNAVTPGFITTDITQGKLDETTLERIRDGVVLGRLGDPEDVGKAGLFLASDLADYITGATLDVNGGMHIH